MQINVDINDPDSIEAALDLIIYETASEESRRKHLDKNGWLSLTFGHSRSTGFKELSGDGLSEIVAHQTAPEEYQEPRPYTSEIIFFRRAAAIPRLLNKISIYVRQIAADNKPRNGIALWSSDEIHAGEDAACALALADAHYISNLIQFLRQCDLDHEVYQADAINQVITKYGWNDATIKLLAARCLSCSGQHGQDDLEFFLASGGLRTYLKKAEHWKKFYQALEADSQVMDFDSREIFRNILSIAQPKGLQNVSLASEEWRQTGLRATDEGHYEQAIAAIRRYLSYGRDESNWANKAATTVEWALRKANEFRFDDDRLNAIHFWKLAAEFDETGISHYEWAKGLRDFSEYEDALPLYDKAIDHNPAFWEAYSWKADALRMIDRDEDALDILQNLVRNCDDRDYLYSLGHLLEQMGRYDEALATYQSNLDDMRCRNNIGDVYVHLGDLDAGITAHLETLAREPENLWALEGLAAAYEKSECPNDALKIYHRAVSIKANHWHYHNMGRIHLMQDNHKAALDDLRKASNLEEDIETFNLIGIAHIGLKNMKDAAKAFQRAIDISPDEAALYANMACVYSLQGQAGPAIDWLRRAFEKGFDNIELLDTDSDFDRIRENKDFIALIDRYRPSE